jgi:hypothetical protein
MKLSWIIALASLLTFCLLSVNCQEEQTESGELIGDSTEQAATELPYKPKQHESASTKRASKDGAKCQEITVPMCRNMPYNATSMPNQFNHYTQQEAAMEAHQFWALVEINCSPGNYPLIRY